MLKDGMTTNTKTTSILKINGMKCHNCASQVEQEMKLLTGVYVAVDLTEKIATVTYDAAQSIALAIENLSYGYEVIKDSFH